MKLHCKFQPLVPFWSEDMEIFVSKFHQNLLKLAEHLHGFCTAIYGKKSLSFLKSKVMYIIQYFRAQNAVYEDFKKLTLLLWSTVC